MTSKGNQKILDLFEKLIRRRQIEMIHAEAIDDSVEINKLKYSLLSLKNIYKKIKELPFEIKSSNDIKNIYGIAKKTYNRIDEILKTDKLKELEEPLHKHSKIVQGIEELINVYGIGMKHARKLVIKHKIMSVNELKKAFKEKKIDLDHKIQLGLKYYGKYDTNIPRQETMNISNFIKKIAKRIDPDFEIIICGSYRRGRPVSSDIDVLMLDPKIIKRSDAIKGNSNNLNNLSLLIEKLVENKFLLDHLTYKDVYTTYQGFCQFNDNPVRRIDIRFLPYESYYTALLYFTGPSDLNTYMRREARRMGYKLSEYGLYKLTKDGNEQRITINSEDEVFEKIGMKPLAPEERDGFVIQKK
jgi:DNA polymerase/3'-5' exonuclease PolX